MVPLMSNQGLGPHWLVSSAGDEARSNAAVGEKKKKGRILSELYRWAQITRVCQPVSTLTHVNLVWDEASRGLCR